MKRANWIDGLALQPKKAKRAKVDRHDWKTMHALAVEADRPMTDEELSLWSRGILDGNARMWNVEYVHAVQAALEQRKPDQLFAMLNAAIPAPSFLLPVIAEVIKVQATGKPGRSPRFTQAAHESTRSIYSRLVKFNYPSATAEEAHRRAVEYLARAKNVSTKTIERSLERTAQP